MNRQNRRDLRLSLERCEPRTLLSAITDILASNPVGGHRGFVPSTTSIAVPGNQGSQGTTNLALAPTGTLTPQEQRREHFAATFTGTYTIGPGRTSTEANVIYIRATGSTSSMLHADTQIRLVTPIDPATPIGGVSATFDRNINANTELGLDLTAPSTNVDSAGRPNSLSMSLDPNISSGIYVEGFAQGVMSIKYFPNDKHTPGTLQQGSVIVKIQAQIYSVGVGNVLANANINPGGPSQGGPNHRLT